MKKSLLMIVAVALAGVASAATVTWNSGAFYTPASADGGNSSTKAKATVSAAYYLITQAEYNSLSGKSGVELQDALSEKTADYTGKSSATTSKANWAWGNAEAGKTYYVAAIYTTTYNDSEMVIGGVTTASVGTAGNSVASPEIATGKTWSPAVAVPEPTTVALLALGLAALGLKRKVA